MRIAASGCLFLLDGLWRFRQTFDFESLGCLQEGGQLVLGYVDFTCKQTKGRLLGDWNSLHLLKGVQNHFKIGLNQVQNQFK